MSIIGGAGSVMRKSLSSALKLSGRGGIGGYVVGAVFEVGCISRWW